MTAFFLVLEGADGVGKTTLVRNIQAALSDHFPIKITQEPNFDCYGGQLLHEFLHNEREAGIGEIAEAFAVNRHDHNARVIEPFLQKHSQGLLICDRYYLSSLVYQSREKLSFKDIWKLNALARRPDLTLVLVAPAHVLSERQRVRPQQEQDDIWVNWRTSLRYWHAALFLKKKGEIIDKLDASGSPDDVLQMALRALRANGPPWLNLG